jgi:hypothetical protein
MSDLEPEPEQPEPVRGAGGGAGTVPAARRKAARPREEETRGRKLSLPDSIHIRLWLCAQERRMTVSAIATEILDKHLPRFRVERER